MEKRENRRFEIFEVVKLYSLESKDMIFDSIAHNISIRGIGLKSLNFIEKETPVILEFRIRDAGRNETTEYIKGNIRWVRKHKIFYYFGISFEEPLTHKRHPMLFEYLIKCFRFDGDN